MAEVNSCNCQEGISSLDAAGNDVLVVVDHDGRAFAASKDTVTHTAAGPDTHTMLAQLSKEYEPNDMPGVYPYSIKDGRLSDMMNVLTAMTQDSSYLETKCWNCKLLQLQAISGHVGVGNLLHLFLISIFPQMLNDKKRYFNLEEAFLKKNVSVIEPDEDEYDLKKLVDKILISVEDVYRTIINPKIMDLSQIYWGFKRKRNLYALKVLQSIENEYTDKIILSARRDTDGNPARAFNDAFDGFKSANGVPITHTVWSPKDFAMYYVNIPIDQQESLGLDIAAMLNGSGDVVPMPGVTGVTAIIDVAVPEGKVYAVNKPFGLRLYEGPKMMEKGYSESRSSNTVSMIDFHEFAVIDDKTSKFGMTLNVQHKEYTVQVPTAQIKR